MKRFSFLPRFKVYYKIILPFLLVIVLGIATTLPYGITIVTQLNRSRADRELTAISRVASNYLNVRMDALLAYTQTIIQNERVGAAMSRGDVSALQRILIPLKARLGMSFVLVYGADGRLIMSLAPADLLPQLEAADIVRKALLGINIKSLDIRPRHIFLLAGVPNETDRGMEGAIITGFQMDRSFLQELSRMVGHEIALVSSDGRLVVATKASLAEFMWNRPSLIENGTSVFLDTTLDDGPSRVLVSDLMVYNSPRARIAVVTPLKEIIAFHDRILTFMLLMASLGSLAVIVMGMLVARALNNPIRRLVALAGEVKRGNLEVQIDQVSRDELGDLTVSFNQMVVGLRENLHEIQSSREKIATYAHELENYSLQLQRDKQEIEAILQNMRDGVLMVDRQGIILAMNPEATRILERETRDCLGQELRKCLAPFLERTVSREVFQHAIDFSGTDSPGEENLEITVQLPHKTVYRIKIHPVFDETKTILGRLLLFTNITRDKEIEEMKNNFLATISHELRTPLTSIKGSLNLLLDGNLGLLTADQREFIKIANNNSERLAALVNNLLDLARMEAGEYRTHKTVCDLAALAKKALSDIKVQAVNRSIKLSFGAAVKGAPVLGDPDRITQLVSNLIDNAIKFSDEGGRVTVNLSEFNLDAVTPAARHLAGLLPGSYFLVQVTDRGKGIPSDQMEKIFDKFHQADMSSTRQIGGSGLGLAISRTIAREHGGALWAENRPEGGSRFSFLLPRAQGERRNAVAST